MIPALRILVSGLLLLGPFPFGCGRPRDAADPTRAEASSPEFPTDPTTLAAALGVPPDSLRAAGEERYSRGAYDSARAVFEVEVARAHDRHDSAAEARAGMWLGMAAWRLSDYKVARRAGEAALHLKRIAGLDAELSQSFNALGLVAWNEGRHRDALALFDSSAAAAGRHEDVRGLARAAGNTGLVEFELGHFDGARRGFATQLQQARALGEERYQGNALANLAMLEIRLGNPSAALPLLEEARAHYGRIGYHTGEANALGQLATALSGLGDLQPAIAAADSGLALARATGELQEVAATLEVLADLHAQAGNLRLALARLHEADSLDALIGLASERGTNLRRSAAILLALGEAVPAVARAEEALKTHRDIEAWAEVVYDRLELAEAVASAGDPRRAERDTDAALAEAKGLDNPSILRDAALVAARLALMGGRPREALAHLAAAPGTVTTDWRLADLKAGALLALGRLGEALDEGQRAIAALERERASLGLGPLRSTYLASRTAPFSRLVAIHLARGDTAAAFAVVASVPGRSLAERLGGVHDTAAPVAALAEGERLLLEAAALEGAIDSLGRSPEARERRGSLEHTLAALHATYEDHLARRAAVPGDRLLGLAPVNLAEIEASLATDEALLTFLAGPERLDLFVVRPDRVLQRSVPIGERALAERVRLARELLARAIQEGGVPAPLGELHDLLLGRDSTPAGLDGVSRLLIVPHGSLGAFPFAALWNRRSGHYLVQDRIVSYLPAVAALTAGGARQASPVEQLMVFAPFPDSLPGTARESRAIKHRLPGATLRLGRSSDETAVREALQTNRSVHLASHGAHNAQNPLFSRVIAGRARGSGGRDDGRLEVHEILTLRTASPLVFLSGCETGLGSTGVDPFAAGTDEGSLSQAFLLAGAGSVVATLWPVGDAGAAELAERFYQRMSEGALPEVALALAQRAMIGARSDFTWAAYAVSSTGGRKPGTAVRATRGEP